MDFKVSLSSAKDSIQPTILMLEDTVQSISTETSLDPHRLHATCRSLLRIGQMLDSANLLAERYRYQDIWILCRSLAELSINTCYLHVAPDIEYQRWSNFDLWEEPRFFTNLSLQVPSLEAALDPKQLAEQKERRKFLEDSGIYRDIPKGSWSDKPMDKRAQFTDTFMNLPQNIFELLYRLAVKLGDGFVHTSPRALGVQNSPIAAVHEPTPADLLGTAQALSLAATSVFTAITFIRSQFGLTPHLLADRLGDLLRTAFELNGQTL